jgi:hypothetical protein
LRVVREATADPFGISGRGQDGHAHLTGRTWPRRHARGRPRRCPSSPPP